MSAPPPGPRTWHPLGTLLEAGRDPIAFLTRMARDYGPVVRTRMGPLWVYVVSDPEGIQKILQNTRRYTKSTRDHARLARVFGRGLLGSQGSLWQRQRRLVQPLFKPEFLERYARVMTGEVEALAESWSALPGGAEVDVYRSMTGLTQRIIGRSMLGLDRSQGTEEVTEALFEVLRYVEANLYAPLELPLWLPTPGNRRYLAALEVINAVAREGLSKARARIEAGEEGDDLGRTLVRAQAELGPEALPDELVADEIRNMFLAGMETTGTALTWTWLLLAEHPGARERLHDELDRVLAGRPATREDVPELEWTRLVLTEALRLYPPIWCLSRQIEEDHELLGHELRAGYPVIFSPYVTQRLPSLWEDPDLFRPERHAPDPGPGHGSAPERGPATSPGPAAARPERPASPPRERPRFASFPFGGGPRKCIGADFAMDEMVLALATLAARFELRPLPGQDLSPRGMVTIRPRDGLRAHLDHRETPCPA